MLRLPQKKVKERSNMQINHRSTMYKNVGISLVGLILFIIIILSIPEGSKGQLLVPFFLGSTFGYFKQSFISKIDCIFYYVTIFSFFLVWFFFVPDPLMNVYFLMGAIIGLQIKHDFNRLNERTNKY